LGIEEVWRSHDKLQLVERLQKEGHIVRWWVTASTMRRRWPANVGIAMGTGNRRASEQRAADLVKGERHCHCAGAVGGHRIT
jgi:hypothetical protein